jgi:hypothetical protein
MTTKDQLELHHRYRDELQGALDELLDEDIRTGLVPNTLAWIGVVIGAFLLNLAILAIVTGG